MNPYAPPQASYPQQPYYAPPGAPGPFQAWAEGDALTVQKEAPLPDCCMKCGSAAIAERRNQNFVFTPPWVFVLFLVSPLIGAIVALIVQKKGRLYLPLCSACSGRWKQGLLFMWLSIAWLIVGLVAGVIATANDLPELGVPLMLSSFVVLIVVAIVNRNKFLRAKKIDEMMITLLLVHPMAVQRILAAAQGR
jgi:uncharacterized membrane protein